MKPTSSSLPYDAVAAAYEWLKAHPAPDYIAAVVVLTDGADTNSHTPLDSLVEQVHLGDASPVRIFPIGYGSEVSQGVMERIAEAIQVKAYQGNPENIDKVFFNISTFF